VLLQAIGAGLPAAVGIALSPFPVIGVVVVLAGPQARTSGVSFAVGWLVGLSIVGALVTLVFGGADDSESTTAAVADWGRVIAGAGLMVLGVRKWRARPRPGDEVNPPAWMASLGAVAPPKALVLGLGLAGANPKNFVLVAAAATSMAQVGVQGGEMVAALAVFVLLASASVIGAVVVRFVGGTRGVAVLDAVREFMVANAAVITMVILVVLGANILGTGLSGLGR
jgi:threonine/homoserine/homoserine lactone efflux protein